MKGKILEHALSLILVSICLLAILFFARMRNENHNLEQTAPIQTFLELDFVDYTSPFHKALLENVVNIYYPGQYKENRKKLEMLFDFKQDKMMAEFQNSHLKENLSMKKYLSVMGMYAKFIFVYLLVMLLTYYGVQTIGVWRFIRHQQSSFAVESGRGLLKILFAGMRKSLVFFFSMISFAPAYVIAYSIRTEFSTDMIFFVVILGVFTNGLLIMYANRFFTLLIGESRKGYVETAVVKNLNTSYKTNVKDGISIGEVLKPFKKFKGHVFGHIFSNARVQYLSTLKEQAAFLITGLIIIEMALNIHGHLSYEMLRQLLQKNYEIVALIFLCFFYTVKFTEIFTDYMANRTSLKFSNNKGAGIE